MAYRDKPIQLKWSDERRLYLIAIIADTILSQKENVTDNVQRILFLADKSNEFLEANYKDEMGENNDR